MKRVKISQTGPVEKANSSFPIFARFYNSSDETQGKLLRYKDGAIPFFIKISENADDEFILNLRENVERSVRVAKGFVFENFKVYELSDYGYQSLSPTFEDVIVLVYDSSGYKIAQKNIVLIKNFTSKKAYVLIPKDLVSNAVQIIIEPNSPIIKTFNLGDSISSNDGSFTFAMDSKSIDNLNDIEIYIEDNGQKYIIPNSDYFITKTVSPLESNSTKTFIQKQGTYFQQKQKNSFVGGDSKVYPSNTITISTDIAGTGKSFFISSKEYYTQSFYGNISTSTFSNTGIKKEILYDVYLAGDSGKMKKLILGIDYYINDDEIKFLSNITSGTIDVITKKDEKLFIPFSTGSSEITFTPQRALYDNHIFKWNVDPESSFVTIYENGLLKGDDTLIAGKTYEYVIEDIVFIANGSAPTANSGITLLSDDSYTVPDIQKYQITTDPNFNTYGGDIESNTQEVYLYDKGGSFNIDALEPHVELDGGILEVQSFTDPYIVSSDTDPNITILEDVSNQYKAIQVPASGKGKVANNLDESVKIVSIENNIAQLKKNFKAILSNSSVDYEDYTAEILNAGRFLFLVVKGTSDQRFNIIYKQGTTIVKKEYGCTIKDGVYISIPFFFDTFVTGGKSTIDFELEPIGILTSPQYHIFK
jgi:hypothetical protein